MTGTELKNIIKSYDIKQGDIAQTIGVSAQAFTSYYHTTDVRQETIDKIDAAIWQLTDGQHGLMRNDVNKPTDPQQKDNIIDTLAGVVKDVERELADIRIIRSELQQQRERMDALEQQREKIFTERMQQLTELLRHHNPFGGVGNVAFPDMAAEENTPPK